MALMFSRSNNLSPTVARADRSPLGCPAQLIVGVFCTKLASAQTSGIRGKHHEKTRMDNPGFYLHNFSAGLCYKILFLWKRNIWKDLRGIITMVEPADLKKYRAASFKPV